MRRCFALVAVWLMPVAVTAADKAEQVANPPYKNWSAFKAGTSVTLKQTVVDKSGDAPGVVDGTARPDAPHDTLTTYTLKSVSPEKVVVEMVQTELEGGSEVEQAPVKITYPAKVDKKYAGEGLAKGKVGSFKEGDEEIEVAGKKVKAHWVESQIKVGDEVSIAKVWYADSVPGGLVKSTTTKKEGDKVLFETTVQVVAVKTGG